MIFYPDLLSNVLLNAVFTAPVVPFIYFNLFYLVPKCLLRKKWGMYLALFTVTFLVTMEASYHVHQYVFRDLIGALQAAETFSSWNGYVIISSENMVLTLVTMALYLVREWYTKEKYARELEQKNTESELNMLKAQLQPHFLFNNLNTIYFLMESKPALAKQVMEQFTDVLSHQLYNAKKDKVSLTEELESLENYLSLQRVRHEDFLDLKYHRPERTENLVIAPMILLTFVENAFKHGQREKGYTVDIQMELKGRELHFQVVNSIGKNTEHKNGGIGLENVKRRLALIYPERHTLSMGEKDDNYVVSLTLSLESHE